MSSAIYPDPPRLVTAVCGHGEQQRLSNARLRLTFYNGPVAYCGPARPGSAFQQSAVSWSLPRARARRVRFGPPDRLSPLGEVYLQPTLTTGHWTGEGGSRERGGEKMVWEPDRFNARVAHRLFMTARSKRRRARPTKGSPAETAAYEARPRFELIKARDLESLRRHEQRNLP